MTPDHDSVSSVLASVGRRDPQTIVAQTAAIVAQLQAVPLLDAVPGGVLILNECRQIVFCNAAAASMTGIAPRERMYGLRPGEALDCRNARCVGGCGTNPACEFCGAARAIAAASAGGAGSNECRIAQATTNRSLDIRVSCVPLLCDGQQFTVMSLVDIADEKRRRALERLFFHDVRNLLGALLGYLQLSSGHGAPPEYEAASLSAAQCLADEIASFEELLRAESGELRAQIKPVSLASVCAEAARLLQHHEPFANRQINVSAQPDIILPSDPCIVRRVLVNLIKNALEASPEGGRVTLDWGTRGNEVFFRVHNHGFIPREVQLQLFQRSFSTKGPGRGLGTYSVRLFTETYLRGRVTVTSCPNEGTNFTVFLPRE